jgi:NAD(P)H dehydrogenase (quinone)
VRFAEVDLRRVDDLPRSGVAESDAGSSDARAEMTSRYRTLERADALADYDAIILGSPARDGVMSAELKHVLDQTEPLWASRVFINKVGSAFTSAGAGQGGSESTVASMLAPLTRLGMILVPPGYPLPVSMQQPSPPASGVAVDADEHALAVARHLGKRVAEVVGWVTHARSHHH